MSTTGGRSASAENGDCDWGAVPLVRRLRVCLLRGLLSWKEMRGVMQCDRSRAGLMMSKRGGGLRLRAIRKVI